MENTQQPPQKINSFDDLFKEVTPSEISTEDNVITDNPLPLTEPTVEEVVTTTPPDKVEEVKNKSIFTKKIQTLLDTGFLENFAITVDDQEVFLSDLEINDEETYNSLLEQIKAEQDNKLKENYISKEGLDETTQKLIEIRKAGGDITEIIKENVQAIDQLSNLKSILEDGEDSEREQLSINILAQDLKQKGLTDKVIKQQIEDFISEGSLESEANKILDVHLSLHKKEIDNKKQQELERVQKEKEDAKNFKKSLSSIYKNLSIPENIQKVLVENATKENSVGITNTDELYFQLRNSKDPNDIEKFAKINYALNNLEKFEEWISGKKVTSAKRAEILKSAIVINTSKTKPIEKKDTGSLDDVFPENNQ